MRLSVVLILFLHVSGCAGSNGGSRETTFVEIAGGGPAPGNVVIEIENPDDPDAPTLWDGPVNVSGPNRAACSIPVSLISRVFADGASMLVVSLSGSTTYLSGYNVADCQSLWPEIAATTEGVIVEDRRVDFLPVCVSTETVGLSECYAAHSYEVDPAGQLVLLSDRAHELTRRAIGVAFDEVALVRDVGDPGASIVTDGEISSPD